MPPGLPPRSRAGVGTYLRAATDDVADSKGPLNYLKKSLKINGAMSLQKARSWLPPRLPWIKPMKISFFKKNGREIRIEFAGYNYIKLVAEQRKR